MKPRYAVLIMALIAVLAIYAASHAEWVPGTAGHRVKQTCPECQLCVPIYVEEYWLNGELIPAVYYCSRAVVVRNLFRVHCPDTVSKVWSWEKQKWVMIQDRCDGVDWGREMFIDCYGRSKDLQWMEICDTTYVVDTTLIERVQ